jgi:hypothetical protein
MNVQVMVDARRGYVNVIQDGLLKIVRFVVVKMDALVMDYVI